MRTAPNSDCILLLPSRCRVCSARDIFFAQNIAILDHPPPPTSGKSGTVVYVKTGFEHPIAISENVVDYTPPQLFTIDYQLLSEERTVCDGKPLGLIRKNEQLQQEETRQSTTQRSILANQIDFILKIDVEDSTASASLEYFANVTSLKGAFISNDILLFPTDSC